MSDFLGLRAGAIRINGRKVESTKGGSGDRRSCGLVLVINEGSADMSAANICLRIPRSHR